MSEWLLPSLVRLQVAAGGFHHDAVTRRSSPGRDFGRNFPLVPFGPVHVQIWDRLPS